MVIYPCMTELSKPGYKTSLISCRKTELNGKPASRQLQRIKDFISHSPDGLLAYFSLLLTKDLYVLHLFDLMLNCAAKKNNFLYYNIHRFYFFPYFELENSVTNYFKNSNELY